MKRLSSQKILLLLLLLLLLSVACNLPYGIGMKRPGEMDIAEDRREEQPVVQLPVGTPTATPTATNLPTFTPTTTPEPTSTATRVVIPSATPVFPVSTQSVPVEGTVVFINVDGTVVPATLPPSQPSGPTAPPDNVFVNGSFDDPWPDNLSVAPGWFPFDNEKAHFGWYKDTWSKVVYDGAQAQLIEIINDQEVGDRVAGIYQTVNVIPGAEYELVIHGLLRSDEGSEGLSGNGYALQYAIDFGGGDDWQNIGDNWTTLPFPEHPREDPTAKNVYNYGTHAIRFRPSGSRLTLFIRGWKRWPDLNEVNVDVDAISLRGVGCQCGATSTPVSVAYAPSNPSTTQEFVPTNASIPAGKWEYFASDLAGGADYIAVTISLEDAKMGRITYIGASYGNLLNPCQASFSNIPVELEDGEKKFHQMTQYGSVVGRVDEEKDRISMLVDDRFCTGDLFGVLNRVR